MLFTFYTIAACCRRSVHGLEFAVHKKSLPLVTGCFLFLPEVLESVVSPCVAASVCSLSIEVTGSWFLVVVSFSHLGSFVMKQCMQTSSFVSN